MANPLDLPAESAAAFAAAARPVRLPAGALLAAPGSACANFLLVRDGTVRVALRGADGRSVTLYRIAPGGAGVLTTSCLIAGKPFAAEAVAETDLAAWLLPRAAFIDLLDTDAACRARIFAELARRLGDALARVDELAFASVDDRLMAWLRARGPQVAATHQQIADELNLAREVVSRHLKALEGAGRLTLGRGRITLDDPA